MHLTNGETVRLYDTSGPYTDPAFEVDVRRGLPALRSAWIDERGDTTRYDGRIAALTPADLAVPGAGARPRRAKGSDAVTQLAYARRG